MSDHTPGPWNHVGGATKTSNYDRIYRALVSVTSGRGAEFVEHKVAYALGEDLETCRANARLIAAAPDLLLAAEFLLEHHLKVCDATCNLMGIDAMRAAIAKARGHVAPASGERSEDAPQGAATAAYPREEKRR